VTTRDLASACSSFPRALRLLLNFPLLPSLSSLFPPSLLLLLLLLLSCPFAKRASSSQSRRAASLSLSSLPLFSLFAAAETMSSFPHANIATRNTRCRAALDVGLFEHGAHALVQARERCPIDTNKTYDRNRKNGGYIPPFRFARPVCVSTRLTRSVSRNSTPKRALRTARSCTRIRSSGF